MRPAFLLAAALLAAPAASVAQAPPASAPATPLAIPRYGEPLSLADAKVVMAAAEAEAHRLGVSPAIAILDSTGHMVMFQRLDNSDYGNGDIAIDLARSAVEFRRSTKEFAEAVARNPSEAFLKGVAPFSGGWPLLRGGRLVGAIGLTGARGVPGAGDKVGAAGVQALR